MTAPLRSAVSPQGILHKACHLYLNYGSDSSTPFRCQPAGHLAQNLQHSLRESYSFFIWGRLTTRAHTRPHMKKASQLTLEGFVEGKGFEPSVSLRPTHAFQACSLNHSDTPLNGTQVSARGVAKIANYFDESKKESISFLN